jgi:hypothetical protein
MADTIVSNVSDTARWVAVYRASESARSDALFRDPFVKRGMGRHLENAPMKFAPPEGLAFFEKLGWNARDCESIFHEAIRLHRLPWLLRFFSLFFPRPDPRNLGERTLWSGLLRLEAQRG